MLLVNAASPIVPNAGSEAMPENVPSSNVTLRPASNADLPAVERLLVDNGLPTEGVAEALRGFVVAESDDRIVGVVGLELCCEHGLLRSTAVASDWAGRGLGRRLVERISAAAESRGIHAHYLLRTSAGRYFPSCSCVRPARDKRPQSVSTTPGVCSKIALMRAATAVRRAGSGP